jgi:hypothetical protein
MDTSIKANVITKTPPPVVRKNWKIRPKSLIRSKMEALKPGECLELRDLTKKGQKGAVSCAGNVRKKSGKKLTLRAIGDTGLDVYCIA